MGTGATREDEMTSSAGVRRGERFDREQFVVARVAREDATAWQALGRIRSRRHGDGHDVHAHRP
jgi:hypothetical protein